MTALTNPAGQPDSGEDCPAATSVGGLARDLEALRRQVGELAELPRRFDQVTQMVTQLADATAAAVDGPAPGGVASWFGADLDPRDPGEAEDMLARLAGWVAGVYLRYPDARLSECWLWHPEVVEELLWLHQAWLAAYSEDSRVTAAADWHDRYRPGVVARVKAYAGMCGLDEHLPGHERHRPVPAAPVLDALPVIAAWWTAARHEPAPAPSPGQLAAADEARRRGAWR